MTPRQPRRASSLIKFGAKNFETEHTRKFDEKYEMVEKLGEGMFGEVFCARNKESQNERAVKILTKDLINEQEIRIIDNEVKILKSVDHPNILKLYEIFEDEETYQIVTDMMRGGSLADDLEEKGTDERFGTLTETDAAILMRRLLSCINYCHHNNMVHRDIKTENIMLEGSKALDHMKVIDFGLSTFFYDENPRFVEMYGTPDYMAPQVINEDYGPKCDIWSCGVVLFEILSGLMPFNDLCERDHMQTRDNIINENWTFRDPVWNSISDSAKDFIKYLLTYEEKDRPTAEQALEHPFLKEAKSRSLANIDTKVAERALTSLESFGIGDSMSLACAVNAYIAAQLLTKEETEEVDELFRAMDTDGDGILTKEEIKASYQDILGRSLSDDEVDAMFDRIDADASGTIGYSEFVVATLNSDILHTGNKLKSTFDKMDADGSGAIDKSELNALLALFESALNEEELDEMMKRADVDGDGEISYEEFVALVTSSFLQHEKDAPEIKEEDPGSSIKDATKKIMLRSARAGLNEEVPKKKGAKMTNPILAMFEKNIAMNTKKGVDSNPHHQKSLQKEKSSRTIAAMKTNVLPAFMATVTAPQNIFEKNIAINTKKGVDSNPHHQKSFQKEKSSRTLAAMKTNVLPAFKATIAAPQKVVALKPAHGSYYQKPKKVSKRAPSTRPNFLRAQ
jgi:calcium-dependent protein kinase